MGKGSKTTKMRQKEGRRRKVIRTQRQLEESRAAAKEAKSAPKA